MTSRERLSMERAMALMWAEEDAANAEWQRHWELVATCGDSARVTVVMQRVNCHLCLVFNASDARRDGFPCKGCEVLAFVLRSRLGSKDEYSIYQCKDAVSAIWHFRDTHEALVKFVKKSDFATSLSDITLLSLFYQCTAAREIRFLRSLLPPAAVRDGIVGERR